jgi:hypothetical protein
MTGAQRRPGRAREPIVRARTEHLLDVVEDLCTFASMLFLVGRRDRAETLVEQSADLLAHRAQILGLSHRRAERGLSGSGIQPGVGSWVSRWMN